MKKAAALIVIFVSLAAASSYTQHRRSTRAYNDFKDLCMNELTSGKGFDEIAPFLAQHVHGSLESHRARWKAYSESAGERRLEQNYPAIIERFPEAHFVYPASTDLGSDSFWSSQIAFLTLVIDEGGALLGYDLDSSSAGP